MLTPSAVELLEGVARALQSTVLPELAPGPTRRQVQAAIGITSRVAQALPRLGPHLQADIADVSATLARLDAPGSDGPDRFEGSGQTDLLELAERARQLHERLADVVDAVARHGGPPEAGADAEIRALLGRMLERQVDLGLSPWEA